MSIDTIITIVFWVDVVLAAVITLSFIGSLAFVGFVHYDTKGAVDVFGIISNTYSSPAAVLRANFVGWYNKISWLVIATMAITGHYWSLVICISALLLSVGLASVIRKKTVALH